MTEQSEPAKGQESRTRPGGLRSIVRRRWWLLLLPVLILCGGAVAGAISYHRFYHHVTQQEVSHAVRHDSLEARIRNNEIVKLQLYQQENAASQPLVLFTSGDGGWSPFCADIAAHIAATGKTVVGFDSKDYLTSFGSAQKPVTPEELVRDYQDILDASLAIPGVDRLAPLTMSGWSLGAGYSVLAASSPELKGRVSRVVAISLPALNELAWKPTDALIYITHGTPHEKVFDAHEAVSKLGGVPLVMLNASDDDTSPVKDAQSLYEKGSEPKHLFIVKAWGHHFEGGESEFYQDLDEAFQMRPNAS
jgi:dienelactone hydrolase